MYYNSLAKKILGNYSSQSPSRDYFGMMSDLSLPRPTSEGASPMYHPVQRAVAHQESRGCC